MSEAQKIERAQLLAAEAAELEAIYMEHDRLEALADDKAFMVHWERKGEGW